MNRTTVPLRFPGSLGDMLTGRLERPSGEPDAWALFAHCFTCSKDLKAISGISRHLAERGIAVFRFDFTGLGESEGDFSNTTFSSNLDDLVAAAAFLRKEFRAPRLLIGHSLGGAAVLAAARRIPESRAVAVIAAPSDTEHLRDLILNRAPEVSRSGEAAIVLGGRPFTIRKQFLEDLATEHVRRNLADLGRALLILHSPDDAVVGIEQAAIIYRAARHPKSFVSLDGADHLLTRERDIRFAGELLAVWGPRYAGREMP